MLDFLDAISTGGVVDTAALALRNEEAKTDTALQSEMIRNLGTYRAIASHSGPGPDDRVHRSRGASTSPP